MAKCTTEEAMRLLSHEEIDRAVKLGRVIAAMVKAGDPGVIEAATDTFEAIRPGARR